MESDGRGKSQVGMSIGIRPCSTNDNNEALTSQHSRIRIKIFNMMSRSLQIQHFDRPSERSVDEGGRRWQEPHVGRLDVGVGMTVTMTVG